MYEHSASGPSLRETRALDKSADLDHIAVYAASGATADNPKWVVCHYSSEVDRRPTEYLFSDGHELLTHIADAVNVPNENEPDEDDKENGY